MAVVKSVKEIYSVDGMRAYTPLVKDAMTWARVVLEQAALVRLENGLPSLQRTLALLDARKWFDRLPSFRPDVHVNIGFGRG